jgi:hypothetical protein
VQCGHIKGAHNPERPPGRLNPQDTSCVHAFDAVKPCGCLRFKAAQAQANAFANPDSYPVDGRGLGYSYGYVGIKHLGTAQYYLMSIKDKDGKDFDGASTYRLTVPANAPVKQYWSVTVYDRATHALIRDLPRASRASYNL